MSTSKVPPAPTPGRLAKDIFCEALDREGAEREAYLRSACAGDAKLEERVRALLGAHDAAPDLIAAVDLRPSPLQQPTDLEPGSRIGDYTIVRTLGKGGFGTVYLAEQSSPVVRRVALKVLREGLRSAAAHARFDAERQALARMEHPGVAHVFDASTTEDGSPYFAMEYVPGVPITEYCHERFADLPTRLRLFRDVCQAIEHAHQKGVVHRDLKPSNVLVMEVDGEPHPKVIDFGVAKAIDRPLTEMTFASVAGQIMGTPAYMSPEQASGEADIDTRADVYALGALLYELLTGLPPFDARALGLARLLQAILDDDPQRPSQRRGDEGTDTTWTGRVPSDLDWIVMRCLEKERKRRYPSASAVASDIQRFLEDLPVDAVPPSPWYRMRKLAQRHRTAFVGSAVLLIALFAGAVGTTYGFLEARAEAERANAEAQRANDEAERANEEAQRANEEAERANEEALRANQQAEVAQAINSFLNNDLLAAAAPSHEDGRGRDVSMREVLDTASERLANGSDDGRFDGMPEVESSIHAMIAAVYDSLGDNQRAADHVRSAHELSLEAFGPGHQTTLHYASELGEQLRALGTLGPARDLLWSTYEDQEALLGANSPQSLRTMRRLGSTYHAQGQTEDALDVLRRGVEMAEDEVGDPDVQVELCYLAETLAIVASEAGYVVEAEKHFRMAFEGRRKHFGSENHLTQTSLANLASFLRTQGRDGDALSLYDEVLLAITPVLGYEHPSTLVIRLNRAKTLIDLGQHEAAEEELRELVDIFRSTYPAHELLPSVLGGLGLCKLARHELDEAETLLRDVYEMTRDRLGVEHPSTDTRRKELMEVLFEKDPEGEEVRALAEESLSVNRQTLGDDHPYTLRAMVNVAILHSHVGEFRLAESILEDALYRFRQRLGDDHLETLLTQNDLVGVLIQDERIEEAEALARRTVEAAEKVLDPEGVPLAKFRARIGMILIELDRPAEAETYLRLARDPLMERLGPDAIWTKKVLEKLGESD